MSVFYNTHNFLQLTYMDYLYKENSMENQENKNERFYTFFQYQIQQIKKATKLASKKQIITDKNFFLQHNVNENFFNFLEKNHYVAKPYLNKSYYINWHANKKYPQQTIDKLQNELIKRINMKEVA